MVVFYIVCIIEDESQENQISNDMLEQSQLSQNYDSTSSQTSLQDIRKKTIKVFKEDGQMLCTIPFTRSLSVSLIRDSILKQINTSLSLFCTRKGSVVVLHDELKSSMDIQCRL